MNRLHMSNYLAAGLSLTLLAGSATAAQQDAIYTMDNAAGGNHVLVFHRADDGQIAGKDVVATDGSGTGSGLASQGSVLLSHDGHWLFACNAGSDSISVFSIAGGRPHLEARVNSGGHMPVSLTLHRNLLYVLNAGGLVGGKDNISGFFFAQGRLLALPGSTQPLSADNTGPAQVSFSEDGDALMVTERVTSLIDTFLVGDEGLPTTHKIFQSAGTTPFGFAVGRNDRVFVSEATGVPNGSSASSYQLTEEGDLEVISASVPTQQNAACWLTLSHDQRYAYTANAASGSISAFTVAADGSLELVAPDGVSGVVGAGSHPVDMAVSRDGRFLFVLANGNGTLGWFPIRPHGTLGTPSFVSGLPTSSAGLAAR